MERRLSTILFADVVGYTRLMGEDEAGTLAALNAFRKEVFEPRITGVGGTIIKRMGDGWIARFDNVSSAVSCAIEIQKSLLGHASLKLRVAVHIGDVTFQEDDIYGDGINVAARIEATAKPGQVVISDMVYHSLDSHTAQIFTGGESLQLKNVSRSVAVWRWPAELSIENQISDHIQTPVPAAPLSEKPSIAVLPFDNMSAHPDQDYFSDGISEDIITAISRLPGLTVIARNSSFTYKGRAVMIPEVCRDLGVRYVLEGSVRKAGQRVRITAQLIDGRSGGHVWGERYDRDLEDIFAVQDDVTEKIVHALEVQLAGGAVPAGGKPTSNLEAYDCVLRGRAQYRLFTGVGNAAARSLYEQAAALDPEYAEPYAGLAETYVQDWFSGKEPGLERALDLARQAAARDPNLPLVQEALSMVHLFNRQHAEAIATARRWITLEPSNAEAYATLAGAMHFAGENEDVIALIDKAMRLNPFYPFFYPHYAGMAHMAMGRFDEAVECLKQGVSRSPETLWPHVYLLVCFGYLQDEAKAKIQLAEVKRISPAFSAATLTNLLPYRNHSDIDRVIRGLEQAGL